MCYLKRNILSSKWIKAGERHIACRQRNIDSYQPFLTLRVLKMTSGTYLYWSIWSAFWRVVSVILSFLCLLRVSCPVCCFHTCALCLVPCVVILVARTLCLVPCALGLVPCPLFLVPCTLYLILSPFSLVPCPVCLVPCPLSLFPWSRVPCALYLVPYPLCFVHSVLSQLSRPLFLYLFTLCVMPGGMTDELACRVLDWNQDDDTALHPLLGVKYFGTEPNLIRKNFLRVQLRVTYVWCSSHGMTSARTMSMW